MKKLLCIALALVLCMSLAAPAFAADSPRTIKGSLVEVTISNVVKETTVQVESWRGPERVPVLWISPNAEITFKVNENATLRPIVAGGHPQFLVSMYFIGLTPDSQVGGGCDIYLDPYLYSSKMGDLFGYFDDKDDPQNFDGSYIMQVDCSIQLDEDDDFPGFFFTYTDDAAPTTPPPSAGPLDGAATWAVDELALALENDLLLPAMEGKWTQATDRLLAAEAIVKLIESSTGKTIDEIAKEKGYDMTDTFNDTNNKAATFLKASGVSNGVGGGNYGVSGVYTRIQMITMLGRMAENIFDMDLSGYPPGSDTFSDLPDWPGVDQFVGWAVAAGVTQGVGSGLFDSNGTLQNQHTGVFAYRAFKALQ